MTFEEKLIQEVKDFVKTLSDRDTALAAKVAAETALDNEVTANMAEADALSARHAMDEAALAATVSTATDELNGAEVLVSEQKSYLLGLIDGNEGTDPTPNETPVVVS